MECARVRAQQHGIFDEFRYDPESLFSPSLLRPGRPHSGKSSPRAKIYADSNTASFLVCLKRDCDFFSCISRVSRLELPGAVAWPAIAPSSDALAVVDLREDERHLAEQRCWSRGAHWVCREAAVGETLDPAWLSIVCRRERP